MRVIYHGPLWQGSTALQRAEGLRHWLGDDLIALDDMHRVGNSGGWRRKLHGALWRVGYPIDQNRSVARLEQKLLELRPDAVIVDSSQYVSASDIRRFRSQLPAQYIYYTPDNVIYSGNRSRWLLGSFPEWDLFFTTKSFNVDELRRAGVRRPILVGKSFDPSLHVPMTSAAVGPEFERFDAVFMGAYEAIRRDALYALAESGLSIVVYCNDWPRESMPPGLELRPVVVGKEYVRALHFGKVALGFLRKIVGDQITQRSFEITAAGRPMLAEKTAEHDRHFMDGTEYVGFRDVEEMIAQVRSLSSDPDRRVAIGNAARDRCLRSGYSTIDRAKQMLDVMQSHRR